MSLGYRLLVLVLVAAVPVFVLQISREVTLRASRAAEIDDNAVTIGRLVAARQNRLIEGVRAILTAAAVTLARATGMSMISIHACFAGMGPVKVSTCELRNSDMGGWADTSRVRAVW